MKIWIYIAVVLLAAAAGFGIYRYAIEPRMAAELTDNPAPPTLGDDAAASPETGETLQPGIPEVLPEFTLADLDGAPRSILSWPGKSMIVNFWATWCAPCRREIPLLKEMQKKHAEEGFQLVGVAVDFREDVIKYAKEIGIDYPVLVGEQDGLEAVNKFGQGSLGFPFTVFTDKQQRIIAFHLGELDKAELDVLLGVVRRVNNGELTPAAGRTVVAKQLAKLPPSDA
jgi:thiol-disulfide isomerase/thioredoxin